MGVRGNGRRSSLGGLCGLAGVLPLQLQRPDGGQRTMLNRLRDELAATGWYDAAFSEYALPGLGGAWYGWVGGPASSLPGALRRDLVLFVPTGDAAGDVGWWLALLGDDLVDLTPSPGLPGVELRELDPMRLAVAGDVFCQVARDEAATARGMHPPRPDALHAT